tara:strand:+ start:21 stop:533 length:513 start_codon:yes stop_codon:yes gene_type:complete
MKKLLVVLLVSLGLQTQAQTTICDSIIIDLYWDQEILTVEPISDMYTPVYMLTFADNLILGSDSCLQFSGSSCLHVVLNPGLADTLTTCVSYITWFNQPDTLNCCFNLAWDVDSLRWARVNNTDSPMGIEELTFNNIQNNKIYDLQGRELNKIPTGSMYIRNRKLYINLN